MQSTHQYQESVTRQERLNWWIGNQTQTQTQNTGQSALNMEAILDSVDISDQAKQIGAVVVEEVSDEFELSPLDKLKIQIIETMLQAFTGKKVKIRIPHIDLDKLQQAQQKLKIRMLQSNPVRAGWGLSYDFSETRIEQEQMSFQSTGQVQTADGKTIDISMQLNMSRSFISQQSIQIRAGDAAKIDPLVINFDAPAAALTERNFQFDLDSDGRSDQISFVQPGSGYLTLDQNGDGLVNNGSELFGPRSGNGFAELAAYDQDNNGWIDEADEVFDQLRIWTRDEQGEQSLFALAEKGIGAIYLGYAQTDFSMRDSFNQENGLLRSTGIFLRENGGTGTVQHVDLMA